MGVGVDARERADAAGRRPGAGALAVGDRDALAAFHQRQDLLARDDQWLQLFHALWLPIAAVMPHSRKRRSRRLPGDGIPKARRLPAGTRPRARGCGQKRTHAPYIGSHTVTCQPPARPCRPGPPPRPRSRALIRRPGYRRPRRTCPGRSPGRRPASTARTLPRSSTPSTLTLTLSPSLTTSVTFLMRPWASSRDVHEPVAVAEEVHERAEVDDLDHLAVVDHAHLGLGDDRLDPLDRRSAAAPSTAATLMVPSSSMSILAPVVSQISRITLPPVPITSRILSLGM